MISEYGEKRARRYAHSQRKHIAELFIADDLCSSFVPFTPVLFVVRIFRVAMDDLAVLVPLTFDVVPEFSWPFDLEGEDAKFLFGGEIAMALRPGLSPCLNFQIDAISTGAGHPIFLRKSFGFS